LNKESILTFAATVGRLRASYLSASVQMSVNEQVEQPDTTYIEDLRKKREMYEEAKTASEALRDAIERGYIEVEDLIK